MIDAIDISVSNTASASTMTLANKKAYQGCVEKIFEKMTTALSGKFVVAKKSEFNVVDHNDSSYFYRQFYQNICTEKYIMIEVQYVSSTMTSNTSFVVLIKLAIVSEIVDESNASVSSLRYNTINVTFLKEIESANSIYTSTIMAAFNIGMLSNSTMCLFSFATGNVKYSFSNSIGIVNVNNIDYLWHISNSNSSGYATLYGMNEEKRTGANLFSTSLKVAEVGKMVTAPMYLAYASDANTYIVSEKLIDMLQTATSGCKEGASYNIGGVEYISLTNIFLIKIN